MVFSLPGQGLLDDISLIEIVSFKKNKITWAGLCKVQENNIANA